MTKAKMLIGGVLVDGPTSFQVVNPANGSVIGTAPECDRQHLDLAVSAAREAFPSWSATPDGERSKLLKAAAGALETNADRLARLLTSEHGKPVADSMMEIHGAAHWLRSIADMTIPSTTNEDSAVRLSQTRHVPIGVVGAISPWNFPFLLSFWKIAPALKAGNTMVLKPSPFTPLAILEAGALLAEILPTGVLNIVTGGDDLGPWLTVHPGIDKVTFTGSTATGKLVMQSAATTLKRLTLELGGNDAAIVLPDVDVDKVAQDIFWASFRNSGQVCVATKRLYVHVDVYEALTAALVRYAKTVKMADGSEQGTQLGPIQNKPQYDRVIDLLEDCRSNGMRFLIGGECDPQAQGYFVPITMIDNPPEGSRIVQEEQFGPILPILKFEDIEDVIARANASEYGLAGAVWSGSPDAAMAVAERLETGTVWVNEAIVMAPGQPFAGHKQSGFGVENGLAGLLEYTVPKTFTVRRLVA